MLPLHHTGFVRVGLCIGFNILTSITSTIIWAQTVIPNGIACSKCRIEVRTITRLGNDEGAGSLVGFPEGLAGDQRGRIWILQLDQAPVVFDVSGRFVQSVGRKGRGPGEFLAPDEIMFVDGDSAVIFDSGRMMAFVVGPDLRVARSIVLSDQVWHARSIKWPTNVLVNGVFRSPERIGFPLHRVSMASDKLDVIESFGTSVGELAPGHDYRLITRLASPVRERIWTSRMLEYSITEWNAVGKPLQLFHRRPSWFANPSQIGMGGPTVEPPPRIDDLTVDANGLLWVFARVPSRNWRTAWKHWHSSRAKERSITNRPTPDQLYHTRIEVINPGDARVLATVDYPYPIIAVLPNGRAAAFATTPEGIPHIAVISVRLVK